MKTIKIKFLGSEYDIQCNEEEVSKLRNLEARLNNRVKNYSKENNNFSDTHKLLITDLYLEDKINDLLLNQKKMIEINDELLKKNESNDELKKSLLLLQDRIKIIINKISSI